MAPKKAQQQPSSNSTTTESTSNYDNGFYTSCQIGNIKLDLLVDSGSSCTLLSFSKFNDINDNIRPKLTKADFSMKDVKGSNILIHGVATVNFKLGEGEYQQNVIVCDITPDGILGQDFMLKYVKQVDYERYIIQTRHDQIHCWVGRKSSMVCRVLVTTKVDIPAHSSMWVSVKIPSQEHLSPVALVEPVAQNQPVQLVSGVTQTETMNDVKLNIVNYSDESVTLYPKTVLGTCMSVTEDNSENFEQCRSITKDTVDKQNNVLPDFLNDLLQRSSNNLNENESEQLKLLLIQYQDVFAKDSSDLGLTDLLEHKIVLKEGTQPI